MKTKRIISFIMAGILVLCSASMLGSCNKDGEGGKSGNGGEDVPLGIPADLKGGGETFDIFLGYGSYDYDFIIEEETGDTINDIIFNRNKEVENYFDIKLQFRPGDAKNSTAGATIRSLIQGGDDTYEVFIYTQPTISMAYEDLFVEWNENMTYAKLDNPWWYQTVQRDINFGDKIYATAGAYNFHALKNSAGLIFNKTLMDELDLEYPYDLVHSGEWTADKFLEYVKAAQKDLNGDGAIDYENDRLGFSGWKYENLPALFIGMGGEPVKKDDNNLPTLNINNERTFSIIDKLIEIFAPGNGAWSNGVEYGVDSKMFRESRLLFNYNTLSGLAGLRALEEDFGIVPFPKLNAEQEEYYARIVNFTGLTYIPVTNNKLDLTSAVLEYMAYISDRDLIPAFYDIILTVRTTRDVESEEMINIIRNGARFLDENFLTSGTIINIVESGRNTLSSNYAAYGDSWNAKLKDIIEFWNK